MDKNTKKILEFVVIIIIVFALTFLARYFYDDEATTLDELHRKNLEGEKVGTNYVYDGFSFVFVDNLWYTQVQRKGDTILDIPLHFGPKELENISIIGENWKLEDPEVYLTFDPDEGNNFKFTTLAILELSLNLAKGMEIKPVAACTKNETSACIDRPIVTCASKDKAVIYLKQTNESGKVKLNGNCVELSGEDWELVKATDRFLLQWYGVMK
ncbi:MAG: hypothetical protein V3V78_01130 [Candidatus Woesearchaeota archaeon]